MLRERLWKIRARRIIAAAGAFERPLVFPDNDRPGVMLAGAALKYAAAYGVACGRRIVIAANERFCLSTWREALRAAGVTSSRSSTAARIRRRRSPRRAASLTQERGHHGVMGQPRGARLPRRASVADGRVRLGERASLDCDLVLNAGGFRTGGAPALAGRREAALAGE